MDFKTKVKPRFSSENEERGVLVHTYSSFLMPGHKINIVTCDMLCNDIT